MAKADPIFANPFRPGAGHIPPYLAGREIERDEFARLLRQDVILENMIFTGLRGVGKTVLLETFKPIAQSAGWLWVGADLSEAATISEDALATRLITDLSIVSSAFSMDVVRDPRLLQRESVTASQPLDYVTLAEHFNTTPGLVSDKLRSVLELVWSNIPRNGQRGIIFAYDEAQNLADHSAKDQYPLSLLLETFQSIQKKDIPFMLVLTGLPTLFPKLVEARTYAERMFRVVFLERLAEAASKEAILKPITETNCPIRFSDESVEIICRISGGYPYFIQFICREVFDLFIQKTEVGKPRVVPVDEIVRKLDTDFFSGRWARATDRQRQLLWVIAQLPNCESEFTAQEVVERSRLAEFKSFSPSHVNQMLATLSEAGLIYKNRRGKYSFAVPLLSGFINRQGPPAY